MLNEKNVMLLANTVNCNIHAQKKHLDKIRFIFYQIDDRLQEEKIFDEAFIDELKLLVDMLFDYLRDMIKDNKECSEYAKKLKDMLEARGKENV